MNNSFVYIFHDENGIPYYVGKSSGDKLKRIKTHFRCAAKNAEYPLARKIRKLQSQNKKVLYQIVCDNLSESSAYELETFLIKSYGRRCDGGFLLNLTLGGEGFRGRAPHNKGKKNVRRTEEETL